MRLFTNKCRQVASTLIIIICIEFKVQSLPINNGFSIKLNTAPVKEDLPKTFGSLFAKIPQELPPVVASELLSENIFPPSVELAKGCTNQIARILFPPQASSNGSIETTIRNQINFINVPVLKNEAGDYKILVVSAPHNFKLGKEGTKPMLVYIVFPFDNGNDTVNMPSIYFVNKSDGKLDLKSQDKVEPILIIDNNRTVTGLKSKEISKFVKFKNKLTNRLNVELEHLGI